MRLVDVIFRRGHLSDAALATALLSGERPAHLDACGRCSARALDLNHWLDDLRTAGLEESDRAFRPERLAVQHAQILRKLEQVDEPSRVIAFPALGRSGTGDRGRRRVAPAWVGVAAAAGLVVGAAGGQLSPRIEVRQSLTATVAPKTSPTPAIPAVLEAPKSPSPSLLEMDLEPYTPEPLGTINEITPRLVASARP